MATKTGYEAFGNGIGDTSPTGVGGLQTDPAIMTVLQGEQNKDNAHPLQVAGYTVGTDGSVHVYYQQPDGHILGSVATTESLNAINAARASGLDQYAAAPAGGYSDFQHSSYQPGQGGPGDTGGAATPTTNAPTSGPSYGTVDNGISTLGDYGFGGNNTSQGGPEGGYSNGGGATTYGGGTTNYGNPAMTSTGYGLQWDGGHGGHPGAQGSTGAAPVAGAAGSTGALNASNPNAAANLTGTQRDAYAYLGDLLNQYGLGSLSKFVITELTAGRSQAEIALDLQQTPEFKAAFPEIDARKAAGLPALSPGEIVSYRNGATQLLRAAGMPAGFYDSPQDFQSLLSGDVSLSELNDRINQAKDATYNIDPATQARLSQEFGLHPGSGGLAAFFLDPNKALPLLQRQVAGAKIGGAADEVGYKNLNNATALDLAQAGVTDAQARQGFNTLGKEGELFNGLPGQQQEQNIGQGQQLAATFLGNVDAEKTIEQRRQSRQSQFTDGGGFASSNTGLGGLGTVQR